jgi:DNA-directed RNA polymerase subunit RPC12/RpoP
LRKEVSPRITGDESICPHCNTPLAKKPIRKTKCPYCGNYILVKKGQLLTEEQKAIEEWLDRLQPLGLTRSKFHQHAEQLAQQFGFQPSVNDIIWRILNALISSTTNRSNLKLLYNEMARIAIDEGKDPKPYLAEAIRSDLLDLKSSGVVSHVGINTANDDHVCLKCRSLAHKVLTVDEALKTMPIPNTCESRNGCRCWYSPVF